MLYCTHPFAYFYCLHLVLPDSFEIDPSIRLHTNLKNFTIYTIQYKLEQRDKINNNIMSKKVFERGRKMCDALTCFL